ncbi:MAG TPA: HAMP domain-containing sensor histidine kinase [Solirubrobacteraceae bacterium]|nr:HAMP domain-containing sensor histidine kinase [Solirubrobacteraceae bacterium]
MALAIAIATAIAVAATFAALYSGTSSRLRAQIDAQLRTQAVEWRQSTRGTDLSTPVKLEAAARRFIAAQRYHAESLVTVVQVTGGRTVTNNAELVGLDEARDHNDRPDSGLLGTATGIHTAAVPEAGSMRVLAQPIHAATRTAGTLRVAGPLTPVTRAQSSMRRTFVLIAIVAVVLAAIAGTALAAVIAAPLRRITSVAAAANAGDLSRRAGLVVGGGEVAVLGRAFDAMLDRLEQAFHRQREFVSDASHELRTPLAVIRAQVELIDRDSDARSRHQSTMTLLRRLDELDRLIGDMLTLAGAEAGGLIVPRPIDVGDFLEDVRRDLPLFGERRFELRSIGGTVMADPDRLTQVVRNLVRNAVAHTQPGDTILVVARAAHDRHLELTVTDTGPGIPPDQLELIFERFHRVDEGRARDAGGTGLGLAIARAIVQAHGGTIVARSPVAEQRGARFTIELPGYRPPTLDARSRP